MKFAIQVNASPCGAGAGLSAYRFAETALMQGHQVLRVFFYREGVYHAFKHALPVDGEPSLVDRWAELAARHGIDLVVCISAAQRRGLLCEDEAKRRGKQDNDLADGFRIGGLGQWVEATLLADRFLEFG